MNKNPIRQIQITSSLLLLLLLVGVACGRKEQNPMAKYQGLVDKSVAAHNQSPAEQTYLQTNIFQISGEHPGEDLPFVTGQESTHTIHVRRFDTGFEINLVGESLPKGAELSKDSTNPDVWHLKWTPDENIIPAGKSFTRIAIAIRLFANAHDPEVGKLLRTIEASKTLYAVIFHPAEQPTIEVPDLSQAQISDQKAFTFSIRIKDPTSNNESSPQVLVYFPESYVNHDHNWYDLSSRVRRTNKSKKPERNKDGTWTFDYILDTSNLPAEITGKTGTPMSETQTVYGLVAFKAYGATNVPSTDSVQRIAVQLHPQKPSLTLGDKILAAKGETQQVHFEVYSSSGHGKVWIDEKAFQDFLDQKKISNVVLGCEQSTGVQQNCHLLLDFDCLSKVSKKIPLTFTLVSALGDSKPLITQANSTIELNPGEQCKSKNGGRS